MRQGMIGLCLQSLRAALRGGNWNNGVQAGVFALNVNNAPSNTNNNIGLRVAKVTSGMVRIWVTTVARSVPQAFGDAILATSGIRLAKYMNRLAWAGSCGERSRQPRML